jgi:hypothetical protein
MKDEKLVARFELHQEVNEKKERKNIAKWLRKLAKEFIKEGDNYSTRFRASYFYK